MITSGETLRLLRQLKGIKQETLAKELGVSQPAYCHLEQRHFIDKEKFEKIISILGYSNKDFKAIVSTISPKP